MNGLYHGVPPKGTQKGDIYAFGIILYEIFGRTVDPMNGPYGETIYSHSEIVRMVAAGGVSDQTDGCFPHQGKILIMLIFYIFNQFAILIFIIVIFFVNLNDSHQDQV